MRAGLDVPGYDDAEQIGAGASGRVYRARQPAFERTVAIKLLAGRLDDDATLRRFERECKTLGAVSGHPNIVAVFDAGETRSGQPYLVMDFVRRGSLGRRIATSGPVPWPEVAVIGVKLAGALQSAHLAGILHRDIKPENVLVSDYDEPLLADFGIAQRTGTAATSTTTSALTPAHAAPEQFSGAPPSVASDVYALASTLFTLLAGRPPFHRDAEESIFAMLARIAVEPPPDLRRLGVPDALAAVVERGLAKRPEQRPSSALALAEELRAAQAVLGTPVTTVPLAQGDGPRPSVPVPSSAAAPTSLPHAAGPYPPPQYAPAHYPPTPYPTSLGSAADEVTVGAPSRPRRPAGPTLMVVLAAVAALAVTGLVLAGAPWRLIDGRGSSATETPGPSLVGDPSDDPTPDATDDATDDPTDDASAGPLDAVLVKAGEPPLADWDDSGEGLLDVLGPAGDITTAYCNRPFTVPDDAGTATATAMKLEGVQVLGQRLYRVGAPTATRLMADVRASRTACRSWDASGLMGVTHYALSPEPEAVTVGDESAESLLDVTAAGTTMHAYELYYRKGGVLSIVAYTRPEPLTRSERALVRQVATEQAQRVAGLG